MVTIQNLTLPTFDSYGFHVGSIVESSVSDMNRDVVADAQLPSGDLGLFERWRWVDGQWIASVDYRGHSWYDPADTESVHNPNSPDDAPPDGWTYWVPGENRVASQVELDAKQWSEVRKMRDRLLADSDWVVTKAVEQGLAAPADWVTYRQGLRDVTLQPDPFMIDWPVKPSTYEQQLTTYDVGTESE